MEDDKPKETLLDLMAKVSGIPKSDALDIWNAVQVNHNKLRECRGPHEFEPCEYIGAMTPKRYRCRLCGGETDAVNYSWYKNGLDHGRQEQRSE
jgi:hypothetical protein